MATNRKAIVTGMTNIKVTAITICVLAIVSCNSTGKTDIDKSDSTALKEQLKIKEEIKKRAEGVELTDAQMKAVGIEIGMIELKNLSSVIKASGQLEVPPQNKADVTALIGGVIKNIFVLEGK